MKDDVLKRAKNSILNFHEIVNIHVYLACLQYTNAA